MDDKHKNRLGSFIRAVRHRVGGQGARSAGEDETRLKLRDLIQRSREELAKTSGDHGTLVTRLHELERTLDAGDPSVADLRTVEAAMPPFPLSPPPRRHRGASVTDDHLPVTRELLVELSQRIVTFEKNKDKKERPNAGGGPRQ